jgi:hypothetical protein
MPVVMDIKYFYLNTAMSCYEYMHIPIVLIPQDIFNQYNLNPLVNNIHIYVEIQ